MTASYLTTEVVGLSPEQRDALDRLKAALDGEPIADDERALCRFLRSRRWRVDGPQGAFEMLRCHIQWRHFRAMNGGGGEVAHGVAPRRVAEVLAPGPRAKMCMLPELNEVGQPVVVLRLGEIMRERLAAEELLASYVLLLDEALGQLPPASPGDFISLMEVHRLPETHPPASFFARLSDVIARHYPNSVARVVVYPAKEAELPQALRSELSQTDPGGAFGSGGRRAVVGTPAALCKELCLPRDALPAELAEVGLPEDDHAHVRPSARFAPYPSAAGGELIGRGDGGSDADAIVTTPWLPRGCVRRVIRLEDELVQFHRLMQPLADEAAEVRGLHGGLQGVARPLLPGATVKLCGSWAYDCPGPTSSVDLLVAGCDSGAEAAAAVYDAVADCTGGLHLAPRSTEEPHIIRGMCRSGRPFSVMFDSGDQAAGSLLRRQAAWVRQQLAEHPAARAAYSVLRHLLETSRLLGGAAGGISGYCLLLLILHCCRCFEAELPVRRNLSPERLLYRFLRYFGQEFDCAAASISATGAAPVAPKRHPGDELSVLDPVDDAANAGAGCCRMSQARAHFLYCLSAVERWDSPAVLRKRGCRGRTPLSSLVSHTPLWARHHRRRNEDSPESPWAGFLPDAALVIAAPPGGALPDAAAAAPRLPSPAKEAPPLVGDAAPERLCV